ncbi:MAG TPA: hypothetical protein VM093_08810 [Aeromicrobium sp.]|nr:hypothetical protein [Aeromicrobium sp.]
MIDRLLPPEQRRPRLVWLLAASLALFAILTVHASTTQTDPYGQNASASDRREVMDRAAELATQAMSYDAATAEADIAAAKDHMTGPMRDDYDRTLPPRADRERQVKSGIKVAAFVSRLDGGNPRKECPRAACAVGISSLTSDRATVLLFVNQYATAKSTKNTVVNPTWEVIRLVRRDGEWLIAGMEAP